MAHSFLRGTSITLISRIINLAIGIVISILLARILGPDGRGIYALAILIPSFAFIFANLGLNSSTIYFLGKKKYSPQQIAGNNIIYSIYIAVVALILTILFLTFFREAFLTGVPIIALVIAVCAIPLRILISNSSTIFLGTHRYGTFNLMSVLEISIQLTLLGLLYFFSNFTINTALASYLVASVLIVIIIFITLRKSIGKFNFSIHKGYTKDAFTYGVKSYFSNVISFLHLRIDQLLINLFLNPVAVGFYAVAAGLTERLWMLSESAATILFPRVSSENNEEEKKRFTPLLCRNVLAITIIGAVVLYFLGEWLITLLYSSDFLESFSPFKILLIGTIFVSGSKILANDIAGRGKPMVNTYINIASLIIDVVLNILLIPPHGIAGAAYATTISYSFVFFVRSIVYARISGNRIRDFLFVKYSDFTLYMSLFKSIGFKKRNR